MGRGRGKGRGGGGEREDQYGGGFGSQDREEHFSAGQGAKSGSGGGFTGGGEAGAVFIHTRKCINKAIPWLACTHIAGGSKKGSQVSYVRQVPKFLQAHAHLLGKGAVASLAGPEGATLVQDVDSDKEDDLEHDDGVRDMSCMPREAISCCASTDLQPVLLNEVSETGYSASCRAHCSKLLLKILSLPNRSLPCST